MSALEQAEQLFRSATAVGPATRPLILFYGLSQAGRAIAAAAQNAPGDAWRLEGHGISARNEYGPMPEVGLVTDRADNKGSFTRLSQILGSAVWEKNPVTLNKLWDMIPENAESPLRDAGTDRRVPLQVEYRNLEDGEPNGLLKVPAYRFPDWLIAAEKPAQALATYLHDYPGARGVRFECTTFGGSVPAYTRHKGGGGEIELVWEFPADLPDDAEHRLGHLASATRVSRRGWYLFPQVAGAQQTMHPIMAWWAVLHALSVLVRYQPAEWAQHIDVDSSTFAVPIEKLLKNAVQIVPELALQAIKEVTR